MIWDSVRNRNHGNYRVSKRSSCQGWGRGFESLRPLQGFQGHRHFVRLACSTTWLHAPGARRHHSGGRRSAGPDQLHALVSAGSQVGFPRIIGSVWAAWVSQPPALANRLKVVLGMRRLVRGNARRWSSAPKRSGVRIGHGGHQRSRHQLRTSAILFTQA